MATADGDSSPFSSPFPDLGNIAPHAPHHLAFLTAEDVFSRTLGPKTPLQLVDWQGYLANPAIEFDLLVPARIALPATVVLRAREPRLHFSLPSTVGAKGPRKELPIEHAGRHAVIHPHDLAPVCGLQNPLPAF